MTTRVMPSTTELRVSAVPGKAVTRVAMRQVRRSGLIVLGLIVGMRALVVATYASVMADPAAAGSMEKLAANPAIRTPGHCPPPAGFLLLVIADSVGAPAWVRQISPFAHLAPRPAHRRRLDHHADHDRARRGPGDGGCRGLPAA